MRRCEARVEGAEVRRDVAAGDEVVAAAGEKEDAPAAFPCGGDRIDRGLGKPEDMQLLDNVAENIMGRTICALGDAAAMPVRAMIKHFRHEFEARIAASTEARSA